MNRKQAVALATCIYLIVIGCSTVPTISDVSVWAGYNQAKDLMKRAEYKKALQLAGERLKTHPNDTQACWVNGRTYYLMGNWDKAIEWLQKTEDLSPGWKEKHTGPLLERAWQKHRKYSNSTSSGSEPRKEDEITNSRHAPEHESDQAVTYPTQEQKLWALATTAVLTESNGRRHDLLGGCERTPEEIKAWQDSLARWWGIHNRTELLETLNWIEEGGHRKEFNKIAAMLSSATPETLAEIRRQAAGDSSNSNRIEIVLRYKDIFGKKSLIAWDYDRYISLSGWGYIAGFLSEEEAWHKIMPVAQLLQRTFDSWVDLGQNHVVGREYWSLEQTQTNGAYTRKCYKRLLTNPTSPWVRLKWDMDLNEPQKDAITRTLEGPLKIAPLSVSLYRKECFASVGDGLCSRGLHESRNNPQSLRSI